MRASLRRHRLLADVTLAAALAALAVVTALALVVPRAQVEPPSTPVIIAWAVALTAPLVVRRRFPLPVLVVTTVQFTRYWAVGQVNEIASWVVLGVAVYSAAAYGNRRWARWVAGICLLGLTAVGVLKSARVAPVGVVEVVAIALFDALPFLLGWPLGVMMRRLREYRAALEERNRQLDCEREAAGADLTLRVDEAHAQRGGGAVGEREDGAGVENAGELLELRPELELADDALRRGLRAADAQRGKQVGAVLGDERAVNHAET